MANQQINQVTSNSEISEDAAEIQQTANNSQGRLPGIAECYKQSPLSSTADGTTVFRRHKCNWPPSGNNNRGLKEFLRDVSKCCLR